MNEETSVHSCIARAFVAALLTASSVAAQPFVQQGPKLVGSFIARQGADVALSSDGNTAIVGGPFGGVTGATGIFTRIGATWMEQAKLVGTGNVGHAGQGSSVAISADGNTVIVGGPSDASGAGAAWVFTRSGVTWTQQGAKLVGSGAVGAAGQGGSVALSADGNTAIVGGSRDGSFTGAVWVFVRDGTTWTQQGPKLTGTGAITPAAQGSSVAISADGNILLAGGPRDDAVWVFTRSGATWAQEGGKLTPSDAAGYAHFGRSVAVSANAATAAIGGYSDGGVDRGATWVFTRSGSTWTQQGAKLFGTGATGSRGPAQGTSVSLSSNGNLLLVGGPLDGWTPDPIDGLAPPVTPATGAAWVFRRDHGTWAQSGDKLVGTGSVNCFIAVVCDGVSQGVSVGLSADGLTAIVGAPFDDSYVGAAWIFVSVGASVGGDLLRAGDHDGDARSDITVYHTASGTWSSLTSASGFADATNRGWGGAAYTPAPGDYDGDGKTDLGLYDEATGWWYVLLSGANFTTSMAKNVGGAGWSMVPGDYDGDGLTDFAVYNTSTGQWYGLNSSTNYTTTFSVSYGGSGWTPVPGDYDRDGKADLGVYNVTTGQWSILLSSASYTTTLGAYCGGSGWTAVPADYDGDGKIDLIVYGDDTGQWYGLLSGGSYATVLNMMWGGSGYQPVKGDYDGDGRADLATYVTDTGMWHILLTGAGYTTAIAESWGGPGYVPLPR
jgi:hypothetical protein